MKKVARFLAVFMIFTVLLGMMPQSVFAKEVSGNGLEPAEDMLEAGEDENNGEEGKLNFIYIENSYVASPGSQMVLVGFGDENTRLGGGTLTVENYNTKEQLVYSSEETLENTILFELPFLKEDAGIYEIKSVIITTEDGCETFVRIADTGMANVYFGVDCEVPEAEEGTLMSESADFDMSDVELQVVALDGNDSQVSKMAVNEIGDALANGDRGKLREEANGEVVVVIDPGHDATHKGAGANGLREEVLNLKIAQYCKAELEEYSGVRVYLTRTGAACPYPGTGSVDCNANRVAASARVGANYYVSIHLNSAGASVRGSEIYYPNSNYNASLGVNGANLSRNISRQLGALGLNQRGILIRNSQDGTKYPDGSLADYYGVIRRSKEAGITAVIVEHAFLTNASDAAFLSSEGNLQRLGIADATGIANYLGLTKGPALVADRAKVEAYVTRLYRLCLGREPEQAGFMDWTNKICSGSITGADAARGFFFSDEFKNKNYSNEEYVELLYRVMMNRGSDYDGKRDWVYKLDNGAGRMGVFRGFTDSREFAEICQSYGIVKGTVSPASLEGRDRNPGLTTFVSRLYTKALGRNYDIYGLNDWCNRICDKSWTVMGMSTTGFFESPEFKAKNLTDEEYVKVLYRTFFDREYDQDGYDYWMRKLKAGVSRREVLRGFADSREFGELMRSYGL